MKGVSRLAASLGWVFRGLAARMHDHQGSDMDIYEVDGLVFRVDPAEPGAWAEFLREGEWEPVYLTSRDVQTLVGARELSTEELAILGLLR